MYIYSHNYAKLLVPPFKGGGKTWLTKGQIQVTWDANFARHIKQAPYNIIVRDCMCLEKEQLFKKA